MEWQGHLDAVGLQCVVIFFIFLFPNLIVIIGNYADVFDGTMIVLAMYTLNLFHPGNYLQEDILSQTTSEGIFMEDQHKPATYHQDKAV
jgi:hypothetical protein